MAEKLSRLNAPEYPLLLSLEKLGLPNLARANLIPAVREVVDNTEIGIPALMLGPNGLPQKHEDLSDLVDRAFSADMAANHFDNFGLYFAMAYLRGGKILSSDVTTSLKTIVESGGNNFNVKFPGDPEGGTLDGIYYGITYLQAMIGSDNAPGNFLKILEQAAGAVEDFRLDRGDLLAVLRRYPLARNVFNYLLNPEVVYQLQDIAGGHPTDPRMDVQTILASVRGGGNVGARGINLNPPVPLNRQLFAETEVQLGYALYEAVGGRSATQHREAIQTAPGVYRFSEKERDGHIWTASKTPGTIADPFCSLAYPREFAVGVKQRFPEQLAKDVGIGELDIEWRTYMAEILIRAQANGRTAYMEMATEELQENNPALAMVYPPLGATRNGANIAGQPVDADDRKNNRYPDGVKIGGVDVGGKEIFVGMIRNFKKMSKAAATYAALYKLLLNPFGDPKSALTETLEPVGEYAREAFGGVKSKVQRERLIPKITDVVMRIAKARSMPVPHEAIARYFEAQKVDFGMYKGTGAVKGLFEELHRGGQAEQANIAASRFTPGKGESEAAKYVKFFFTGK